MQFADFRPHLDPHLGIQIGEGFVKEEHRRFPDNGSAHSNALTLSAGQRFRFPVKAIVQAEDLRRFPHPFLNIGFGNLPQFQPERQIFIHGHVGVKGVILKHHGYIPILRGNIVHHPVTDPDRAVADILQTGDHPQHGGFSAAGGPHQHHKLTVLHVHGKPVDGKDAALIDFADFADRYVCHGSLSPVQFCCCFQYGEISRRRAITGGSTSRTRSTSASVL